MLWVLKKIFHVQVGVYTCALYKLFYIVTMEVYTVSTCFSSSWQMVLLWEVGRKILDRNMAVAWFLPSFFSSFLSPRLSTTSLINHTKSHHPIVLILFLLLYHEYFYLTLSTECGYKLDHGIPFGKSLSHNKLHFCIQQILRQCAFSVLESKWINPTGILVDCDKTMNLNKH